MSTNQLQHWLSRFVLEVYPPNTLHHLCAGLMRHVRWNGNPSLNIFQDGEFADFRATLDAEMKRLQAAGVGTKKKQAEILTEEEDLLWEKNLLGAHNPETLLDTVIFYNGLFFALRGGKEHRQLRREPCQIEVVEPPNKRPFLRYSEDVSKNHPGGLKGKFFTNDPSLLPPPLSFPTPDALLCSPESVCDLISSLPTDSSPGFDGITPLLLKSTAVSISFPLSQIFNCSIISGTFPKAWKSSIIVPIPKTSPPSASPSDYRPISFLSIVSKLLEKLIANILLDHLFTNNLIPPNHFGFLPSRSTTDALTSVSHSILSSLDSFSSVCGVFLDIRKAFDSISHPALLQKLYSIDLPSNICSWFYSYLTDWSQSVRVGECLSSPLPVLSGVPQGSILGPLLFIAFFNDIVKLSPSFSANLYLYADDILLLHPISDSNDIISLNSELSSIHSWLSSKFLQINVSKSKFMIFSHRPQFSFNHLPQVKISDSILERVSTFKFKYLGIIFKPNLSWSDHILYARLRAKRTLGLIYRHFYKHCSSSTLLLLYQTLVRPILEYCSILWDPPSSSVSSSLESIQHFAMKIISKSWTSPYSSLLSSLNLHTLQHRRKAAKVITIYKLKFNYSNHNLPKSPLISPSPPHYITRHYSPFNFIPISANQHLFQTNFFPLPSTFGIRYQPIFLIILYQI